MDGKTKEALKLLQNEIKQLQALIVTKDDAADHPPSEITGSDSTNNRKTKGDIAVQLSVKYASPNLAEGKQLPLVTYTAGQLSRVTDDDTAAVGYAMASVQKVGLLRCLYGKESENSAHLGSETKLTTGSLYHHLRELMRADLVKQSGRNRYVLTERGNRTLLVLQALAAK